MKTLFTGERWIAGTGTSPYEQLIALRHAFAYETACGLAPPGAVLLDVGCGHCDGLRRLRDGGRHAHGLDVDFGGLAAGRGDGVMPAGSCALFDGRRLPVADRCIDVVTCFQVIEHVERPREVIAECARALRTGGVLLLTTPNRLLRLAPGERPWNRFHRREYSPRELHELLAAEFSTIVIGVRGTPTIEALERARLQGIRRLARLDVLRLRHRLPEPVNRRVRAFLRGLTAKRSRAGRSGLRGPTSTDLRLSHEEVEEAMDLFAICHVLPEAPGRRRELAESK